jgi:hypothetical protein
VSTSDTIFIHTQLALDEIAHRIETRLGLLKVVDGEGRIFLGRKFEGEGAQEVGGQISANPHRPAADPGPDEVSVLDGYEIAWEVRTIPRDETVLHAGARALFGEIVIGFPDWPTLLVQNLGLLVVAYRPDSGLVEFPEGISPDDDDRELWRPFDALRRP